VRRHLLVWAVALGALATAPGIADAATLTRDPHDASVLVYTAAAGEYNHVVFTGRDENGQQSIEVDESGCDQHPDGACPDGTVPYTIDADPGSTHCVGGPGHALCDASGISKIVVYLGDEDNFCAFTSVDLPVAVFGGPGNDTISGTDLPSRLVGGDGTNVITGGASADVLIGGAGNDLIKGGGGNDTIDAGSGGNNTLISNGGNVTFITHAGTNVVKGGPGNDTLLDGPGADDFTGGGGIDTVSYAGRDQDVTIEPGGDAVSGTPNEHDQIAADVTVLVGGNGNDRVVAPDPPIASDPKKQIAGYTLVGGPGNDTLIAHGGADRLDGGAGDDLLVPGTGPDTVIGGPGEDTVSYAGRDQGVEVTLDGKPDSGAPGERTIVEPDVEDIVGGNGDNTLIGNTGRNKITGGPGNDYIDGGGGDDVLDGGLGTNTILCGPGKSIVNYTWETDPIRFAPDGLPFSGAAGQHDTIGPGCRGVLGSPQADMLMGGPGPTFIYGDGGGDTIFGGPSAGNLLVTGDGDAYVDAMNGKADFVSCGNGKDTVLVDPVDSVAPNCEKPGDTKVVGTEAQITTAPAVAVVAGAVTVPVSCQPLMLDPCTGTVRLSAKLPAAALAKPKARRRKKAREAARRKRRRRRHGKPAKPSAQVLQLGSVAYTADPGKTVVASVRLTPQAVAALRRLRSLSVTAEASSVDRAKQVSIATQTFVLRRK
jgi:Ca2+-binding RTX toxin-like protein